ncbi:MAG: RagB/SusD family nutrient uptake outer membrane protein [Muribaculaceae bacterium]|nr:RagB/SusD family nutrient uptake outer membrane protein [Muribaculaceae bacterium]
MKSINKVIIGFGVAAMSLGLGSCVNDLDLKPTDPNKLTDVRNDMDRVFADIYLNFSTDGANGSSPVMDFDGGMANFSRAMFTAECMPTDEVAWLWDPEKFGNLKYGTVTPSVPCMYGVYSRLTINIALCNQFIASVNNGDFNLSDENAKKRSEEYIRQAKTLRGLCYYYMMSFYDKVPYSNENTSVGEMPEQKPRAEVYDLVTSDLEGVVADYAKDQVPYYGFAGRDAAQAVLAKIYLNGEVFAGRADYNKCYAHCKDIIDHLGNTGYYGTGLARSYHTLFGANNKKYVLGNGGSDVNEIILASINDRINLKSWGNATFMIDAWVGTSNAVVPEGKPTDKEALNGVIFDNEDGTQGIWHYDPSYADPETLKAAVKAYNDDLEDWQKVIKYTLNGVHYTWNPNAGGALSQGWLNAGDGWKCLVARKIFVEKFTWNDAAKSVSPDTRTYWWQTSAHNFTIENKSLLGDDWGTNGYLTPKYSNWVFDEDGSIDSAASAPLAADGQPAADYALIRLSEIYLTAAEAILNGGGGSMAEALKYVNAVRQRAYSGTHLDADGNEVADYQPWTSLSMEDLRDERARELYNENVRRTDLIRWNMWTTGYTWDWKGGVRTGTNLPEYTKLYPIPERVMVSSNFRQTTGY